MVNIEAMNRGMTPEQIENKAIEYLKVAQSMFIEHGHFEVAKLYDELFEKMEQKQAICKEIDALFEKIHEMTPMEEL